MNWAVAIVVGLLIWFGEGQAENAILDAFRTVRPDDILLVIIIDLIKLMGVAAGFVWILSLFSRRQS